MPGKQARTLSCIQVLRLLNYAAASRHPERNQAMVLLSIKAGLRAGEIARLSWDMVLDAGGARCRPAGRWAEQRRAR